MKPKELASRVTCACRLATCLLSSFLGSHAAIDTGYQPPCEQGKCVVGRSSTGCRGATFLGIVKRAAGRGVPKGCTQSSEWKLGRFQVRADRERTHHPARLELDESIRHTSEKLPQRQVPLLLVDFGEVARLDPSATFDVPRLRSRRAEGVSTSNPTASPRTPKQWHASTSKAARAGPPSPVWECGGVIEHSSG